MLYYDERLTYFTFSRKEMKSKSLQQQLNGTKNIPTLEPMVLGQIEQHMTMQPAEKGLQSLMVFEVAMKSWVAGLIPTLLGAMNSMFIGRHDERLLEVIRFDCIKL